jgi:hypothetical protein
MFKDGDCRMCQNAVTQYRINLIGRSNTTKYLLQYMSYLCQSAYLEMVQPGMVTVLHRRKSFYISLMHHLFLHCTENETKKFLFLYNHCVKHGVCCVSIRIVTVVDALP